MNSLARLGLLLSVALIGSAVSPMGSAAQSGPAFLVGAADIASCNRQESEATAKLLDSIAGTVFTAGDHAYPNGTAREFIECYGLSWGRHRTRTLPAPGNHDYDSSQAGPYFNYFGSNAGPTGRAYYSYNLGAWHVVSLNSNVIADSWGAAQEEWLRADLKANPANCLLAYWHHPRFSSGKNHGNHPHVNALYKILYQHGISVLISGHDHVYERFAPQDPDGKADSKGVRQFLAGTGGAPLYKIGTVKPNSEVRNTIAHGVLKLTLNSTSYDWEFVPVAGQTFRDRGSTACVGSNKNMK
ncbi:MAG: metallophosphoesterase [Deltaproteobacteria bacterium]|nr:metallophosphoesterase [Deltaproteobacteria bacterium]